MNRFYNRIGAVLYKRPYIPCKRLAGVKCRLDLLGNRRPCVLQEIPHVSGPFPNLFDQRYCDFNDRSACRANCTPNRIKDIFFDPCSDVFQRIDDALENSQHNVLARLLHLFSRGCYAKSILETVDKRCKYIFNNPSGNVLNAFEYAVQDTQDNIAARFLDLVVKVLPDAFKRFTDFFTNRLANAGDQFNACADRSTKKFRYALCSTRVIKILKEIDQAIDNRLTNRAPIQIIILAVFFEPLCQLIK